MQLMWCNVHNNTLLINLQTREAYKNAFLPIFLSPAQNEASRAESLTAGWLAAQCAYAATRNWETAGISGGFNWRVSVSRNLIIARLLRIRVNGLGPGLLPVRATWVQCHVARWTQKTRCFTALKPCFMYSKRWHFSVCDRDILYGDSCRYNACWL